MRIEQRGGFLRDFVHAAHRGHLVPAAFQRPYVWTRGDVIALCESVLEGFPLGTFVFWVPRDRVTASSAVRHRLGPVVIDAAKQDVAVLLDGQNRLATLAWLMHDYDGPLPDDLTAGEIETWAAGQRLVANLRTKQLEFVDVKDADADFRLPAYTLLDSRRAHPLMRKRWDNDWAHLSEEERDAGFKWFDEASAAFSDAKVVATWIEHESVENARRAFLHICRVGVPMSAEDFDKAIEWTAPA